MHDGTTHNIANKGFCNMRRVVARSNFSCTLIGNCPQPLTGHIVKRQPVQKLQKLFTSAWIRI